MLNTFYCIFVVILMLFWFFVLLWGLMRDSSIWSKVGRLLLVIILWRIPTVSIEHNFWYDTATFWRFADEFAYAYPWWLIIILTILVLPLIYGYVLIYREKTVEY